MIQALLHRIEADILGLLDDAIAPANMRTRRCPTFYPDRGHAIDVTATPGRIEGAVTAAPTTVEIRIRGVAAHQNSTYAMDIASWMVDVARDRAMTESFDWNANHVATDYTTDIVVGDAGVPVVSYTAIVEFKVTHRSNAPNTIGVALVLDAEQEFGHSIAQATSRVVHVGLAGQWHDEPITVFYGNAEAGDVVELLDAADVVVASEAASVGSGMSTFATTALPNGTYRGALSDGVIRVISPGQTELFHQPAEPA